MENKKGFDFKKFATGNGIIWLVLILLVIFMFAINIPQESVTIPETMDGIRAACNMQAEGKDATEKTNEYLGIGLFKNMFK